MKLKIEAIIELGNNLIDFKDEEEIKWLDEMLNDKKNTTLILWSNDIGDEIGKTNKIKITKL